MKVKTTDLIGPALRYAVAVCEGFNVGVITADEQWERFIEGALPEDLEKHADYYAAIKAGFKTELCKIHGDGYKSALDARGWRFDEDWGVGGSIIEREAICIETLKEGDGWCATKGCTPHDFLMWDQPYGPDAAYGEGPTPLIAAMRCFVTSILGDEVDVPDELV